MKIKILITLMLFTLCCKGQILQKINTYGYEYKRVLSDTLLGIPNDTLIVPAALVSYAWLARKNNVFYMWSTTNNKWESASASGKLNISDTSAMLAPYLHSAGDLSPLFTTTESGHNITFTGSNVTDYKVLGRASGTGAYSFLSLDTNFISGFSTYVRPLLSAGTGISYNSLTGVITNSSPGTTYTASNLTGNGVGVYKTTVANDFQFKRLKAGTGISITDNTDSVTIASTISQGVTTMGAIGAAPNANAATITGSVLNLEPASASFGGVVIVGTQTFAGDKTINGTLSTRDGILWGDGTTAGSMGQLSHVNAGADKYGAIQLKNGVNAFTGNIYTLPLTANRLYALPDAGGTIALTSNITGTNSGTNTGDQSLANTSDATSHTVTLTGGTSMQIAEGSNITLTTTGTGGNGIVTIASTGGGISSLSAIGAAPNANAATITGSVLNLEPASASFGGVVIVGTQTFSGAKTFQISDATTNTYVTTSVDEHITSGLAASGFGARKDFKLETSTGTSVIANSFISRWTTATTGNEYTEFLLLGKKAGVESVDVSIQSNGNLIPVNDYLDTLATRAHARSIRYTTLSQFVDETAWRVFYSNASGDVTPLALGGAGTYLQSNGAAAAPTWVTPGGSGTVTDFIFTDANGFDGTVTTSTTTPTLSLTTRAASFLMVTGTDANITVAAGTAYHLPTATLTVGRNLDMTSVNANGDFVEFYNNEEGFVWTFTGQTVYDSDGATAVTQLLLNTNSVVRRINGKLMISKL